MSNIKAIASEEQILDALSNTDWDRVWPLLQAHALFMVRYRYGIKKRKEELAEYSRELVQESIKLVFVDKTRKWNMDAYPQIEDFLYGVIDSHLSNQLKTKVREIPSEEDSMTNQHEAHTLDAQQEITAKELRNQIIKDLQELKADDEEMLVFECLFDGLMKPETIRAELGLSESEFHNIWRKVNRKREKLKIKLEQYGYR